MQVAFLPRNRVEDWVIHLRRGERSNSEQPMLETVWKHFSSLNNIKCLGESLRIRIIPILEAFEHKHRQDYIGVVEAKIREMSQKKQSMLVFLDPDTGFITGSPKKVHVGKKELVRIWCCLSPNDWLVIYQHFARVKKSNRESWLRSKSEALAKILDIESGDVHVVTGEKVTKGSGKRSAEHLALLAAVKVRPHTPDRRQG